MLTSGRESRYAHLLIAARHLPRSGWTIAMASLGQSSWQQKQEMHLPLSMTMDPPTWLIAPGGQWLMQIPQPWQAEGLMSGLVTR